MDIKNQTQAEAVQSTEVNQEPTTQEPVTPQEPQEIDNQGGASEPELYELPDGRKVDAQTLSKEWKENFYPEYTRKSQELSKVKGQSEPVIDELTDDYQPQTYAEIIKLAEERAVNRIKIEQEQQIKYRQQVEESISKEIEEIKKDDPNVNENAVYQHANKWGFTSLKQAYENMKEIKKVEQTTEQRVVKNIQARQSDPISSGKPVEKVTDGTIDYSSIYNESPMQMLKRLNNK